MALASATPGKNVFIVLCHNEKTSFSHALADRARSSLEERGYSVVTSDLYGMGFDPVNDRRNFTSCVDSTRLNQQREEDNAVAVKGFNSEIQAEMDKLDWCNYLIFISPIHWFGLPAMLKGWCDKVLARGYAYGSGKWFDSGVFLGKRALLCMTTGAPEFMYKADHIQGDIRDITYPITHGIFWFCGFAPVQSHFVYSPSYGTDASRAEELARWGEYVGRIDTAPTIRYRGFTEVQAQHKAKDTAAETAQTYKYSQKCFCGAVETATNADPMMQAYCHCSDCQAYTGAAFMPFYAFPPGSLVVLKGAHHIKTINKYGRTARRFCGLCSAQVVNEPAGVPLLSVSAVSMKATNPDVKFTAACHIMYTERMMDIKDGLPKYKGFPGHSEQMSE